MGAELAELADWTGLSDRELLELVSTTPDAELVELLGDDGLRSVLNSTLATQVIRAPHSLAAHVNLLHRDDQGRAIVPAAVHKEWIRMLEQTERYRWLVIIAPPGYAKSTICTKAYTTWRIGQQPTIRIGLIANTANLAWAFAQEARTVIRKPLFRTTYGEHIRPDYVRGWRQDMFWVQPSVDNSNPTVLAAGIDGPVQGKRFDEIILDDPTTQEQARSPTVMRQQRQWVSNVLLQRFPVGKRPPDGDGRMVVVLTRWGTGDLVHHLVELGFTAITFPALGYWDRLYECQTCGAQARAGEPLCSCEEVKAAFARDAVHGLDDVCKVTPGEEALWEEGESREKLEQQRENEPLSFELVMQGNEKALEGGTLFDEENFRHVEELPPLDWFDRIYQYVDTSGGKDRQKGDYTAHVTLGFKDREVWVLWVHRDRIPATRQIDLIPKLYEEWSSPDVRPRQIGIEDANEGTAVYQLLEESEHVLPLKLDTPIGDKEFRATPIANAYEAKRVIHGPGRWRREYEAELTAFPTGEHDDMVDAAAGAYNLGKKGKTPRVRRLR